MSTIYERALPFVLERSEDGDGLTLEGYAAVFNSPTRIIDRAGEYDEVIAPGAFKRTISQRKPVLMFEHGKHPLIGSMPIGAIQELREDVRGLYVKARMFDNWLTEPLRHAIRDQAIDGMSFKFSIPDGKETVTKRSGDVNLRTVREVKMYELGPVTFPAYDTTTVALRSLQGLHPDLFDALERTADLGDTLAEHVEDSAHNGTPEELAARGTSDGPADDDPPPTALVRTPSTPAGRAQRLRQIQMSQRGIGKK